MVALSFDAGGRGVGEHDEEGDPAVTKAHEAAEYALEKVDQDVATSGQGKPKFVA